jgi:hypothetical protein
MAASGYEPIAGHRASTPLVKYLSVAPFRVLVVSMLANLVIEANRFEATSQPLGTSTVDDPKAQ